MKTIQLKTGLLKVEDNKILNELVEFSSRQNKKRGFLFVSKVLGKHIPTKPSIMEQTYKKLSKLIPKSDEKTLFIGFAETATALGQGVFEASNLKDSFYIHSTRYTTNKKVLLQFYEEHCHAPSHIFYEPTNQKLKKLLKNITRVILIDDEVSTGNTANNLVIQLKKTLPNVKKFYLLTILNWSNKEYKNFEYLYLYKGDFSFTPKNLETPKNIVSELKIPKNIDNLIPKNFGRFGIEKLNLKFKFDTNLKNKKVLVLGTGEFMYPPYLFAKFLEENGIDVYFQATTRSPINVDLAIKSKLNFKDNYFEEIDNFLYNVIDKTYDKIFICYETTSLPKSFNLKQKLLDLKVSKDIEEIKF